MGLQPRPAICDRARTWVSLRLDGELSELEGALLQSHLRHCVACAEYADALRETVDALRAQPLEQLEHPITVSARRRARLRPAVVVRAAAAVAVIAGVASLIETQPARRAPTPTVSLPASATSRDDTFQQLRTVRLIRLGGSPPRRSGIGEFGAVLSQRP